MFRFLATLSLCAALLSSLAAAQSEKVIRKVGDFKIIAEAPALGALSQGRTGTCWSFATVSYFEAEVRRATGKMVDLSEMWPVREAWIEKTKRYIEAKGKNTFGQGGLSHDITHIIEHDGLLPASAYTGLLPGHKRHDHGEMARVLKGVADALAKSRRRPSKAWKNAVTGVTDAYMGKPPSHIVVDGKTLTPLQYSRDVLGLKADNYIEVMSTGSSKFNKPAKLDVPDNWMHDGNYLNLPIDEFIRGMRNAVMQGYTIAVDTDVSEPGFNPRKGTASLPAAQEKKGAITQAVRDEMFKTKKTTDDHLMHIVGLAKGPKGGYWYYTKNSWGRSGPFDGYLFISEPYLRAKALAYMVNKKALTSKAR